MNSGARASRPASRRDILLAIVSTIVPEDVALPSFLDVSRPPETSDAIFVFAGRDERKRFGLELFEEGFAPRLILSVGRFEWRRFAELGLPGDGGLTALVPTIEPAERHFFADVTQAGVTCEPVKKTSFGTLTEAEALARIVERDGLESLLVVSSREHLPRCLLALRATQRRRVRLILVASRSAGSILGVELLKLAGYGFLTLPRIVRVSFRKR